MLQPKDPDVVTEDEMKERLDDVLKLYLKKKDDDKSGWLSIFVVVNWFTVKKKKIVAFLLVPCVVRILLCLLCSHCQGRHGPYNCCVEERNFAKLKPLIWTAHELILLKLCVSGKIFKTKLSSVASCLVYNFGKLC